MNEPAPSDVIFEVSERWFNRHDRALLLGLSLSWGFAGPVVLLVLAPAFLGTTLGPGVFILAAFIVAVAGSLYLMALRYNRFGVYETGIAPTKRPIGAALRLRGKQYLLRYAEMANVARSGSWAVSRPPEDQTWYFTLDLRSGQRWILPAVGLWEAIGPALREGHPQHVRELRRAYDALAWVGAELNRPERRGQVQNEVTVRVSAAAFRDYEAGTSGAGRAAAGRASRP